MTIKSCLKDLKKYRLYLNRQQVRTFRGQILSGNFLGFYDGLNRVLIRIMMEGFDGKTEEGN